MRRLAGMLEASGSVGEVRLSTHVSETRIPMSACTQDRADTRAFLYDVEDGKSVEVSGDSDHRMTRGWFLREAEGTLPSIITTLLGCGSQCGAADQGRRAIPAYLMGRGAR